MCSLSRERVKTECSVIVARHGTVPLAVHSPWVSGRAKRNSRLVRPVSVWDGARSQGYIVLLRVALKHKLEAQMCPNLVESGLCKITTTLF